MNIRGKAEVGQFQALQIQKGTKKKKKKKTTFLHTSSLLLKFRDILQLLQQSKIQSAAQLKFDIQPTNI